MSDAAAELQRDDRAAQGAARSVWRRGLSLNVGLLLPAQLLVAVVVTAPTIIVIFLALTDWQPTQGTPWYEAELIWFWNFYDLVFDERFLHAVARTTLFVGACVSIELVLAIGLALLFLETWRGRRIAMVFAVLPMMIVPVDAANAFFMLFGERGPINYLVGLATGEPTEFAWLGSPATAMLPIAFAEIWQWTPMIFLLVLSGFLSAPRDQYRAAIALGASSTQAFFRITLPHALPIIGVAVLLRSIETFKIFDSVYILTRGGPGSASETISMFMFNGAFVYFRIGYVAAAALMVLALVVALCVGLNRMFVGKVQGRS